MLPNLQSTLALKIHYTYPRAFCSTANRNSQVVIRLMPIKKTKEESSKQRREATQTWSLPLVFSFGLCYTPPSSYNTNPAPPLYVYYKVWWWWGWWGTSLKGCVVGVTGKPQVSGFGVCVCCSDSAILILILILNLNSSQK